MEENQETAVKIEIELMSDEDENLNLLRVLRESESMDIIECNPDHYGISSDTCDNSPEFNLAGSPSLDDDNSVESSQNARDDSNQNEVLKKYNDMSVEVSIDRVSNSDGSELNVDKANSPTSETSQPVSSETLKSVEELSTSGSCKENSIKSQTYGDSSSLMSRFLRGKTTSEKSTSITIIKPPTYKDNKHGKVELYAPDTGPKIYPVKGNIVTPPIITKNLPEAFRALPVHGKAETKADLPLFYRQKIRDYVGYGISDDEFKKLENYCSPDYLRTGNELSLTHNFPSYGPLPADLRTVPEGNGPGENLCIVKKLKLRMQKDKQNHYPRRLKYRGLRLLPLAQEDEDPNETYDMCSTKASEEEIEGPLEPGRDLIFRVRFYRPHAYGTKCSKPTRHSVFNNDIVLLGRQKLSVLRDRIGCPNDIGMRIDMSEDPDDYITESAKRVFPSGFLFINNVFYVDRRRGCSDQSAGIREWARRRRLGAFPVRELAATRLDRALLRLGHPEVYMHQGKCEHLFTFSEVRLLGPSDPLRLSSYPCHTAISQNQSVYCTTCAEFVAKWVVVGCSRVPFDPAFFCETCFKLYLYDKDGKKIGDFKAYSYKGNTVNFLKPIGGYDDMEDDGNADEDGD